MTTNPPNVTDRALSQAFTLTQDLSPNEDVQLAFRALYGSTLLAGESNVAVVTALVGALLDGLRHGNWPKSDR